MTGPAARPKTAPMIERFTGSFTQQEPIPEAGIEAALDVMRGGRLHRYNTAPGEVAETALLEREFAAFVNARYCLATASGGSAMTTALRGGMDRVTVMERFTWPDPVDAGVARPAYHVEKKVTMQNDIEDLRAKAGQAAFSWSNPCGALCTDGWIKWRLRRRRVLK